MTLVRWNPMRDMMTMQNELNKIFSAPSRQYDEDYDNATWSPVSDVIEDNDTFTIQADLPGMNKADVTISFKENVLTLKGERKNAELPEGATSHREERVFGRFFRSYSFPTPVSPDKIEAKFNNGVLTVTIPKAEEAKPRAININ
jgi:HSP20 family protein